MRMQAVTMLFDIGRDKFPAHARSLETYLKRFHAFFSAVDLDLLVITTPEIKEKISGFLSNQSVDFRARITFSCVDHQEFSMWQFKEAATKALSSYAMASYGLRDRAFKNKLLRPINICSKAGPGDHPRSLVEKLGLAEPTAPEYTRPEYLCLVWSKVEALVHARDIGFSTSNRIAFIDFAFAHSNRELLALARGKSLVDPTPDSNQVDIMRRYPGAALSSDAWYYSALEDDALVAAALIVCPNARLDWLNEVWVEEITASLNVGLAIDDQTILGIIASKYPSSFLQVFDNPVTRPGDELSWYPVMRYLGTVLP
jgi:hypothetical protein